MAGAASLPGFQDLDDDNVYERFETAVIHPDTRNFVIEFDSSKAYAALNFDDRNLQEFLTREVRIDFEHLVHGVMIYLC